MMSDVQICWWSPSRSACGQLTSVFPSLVLAGSAHSSRSLHIFDLASTTITFRLEGVAGHTPECPLHSCGFIPKGAPSTEWCIATCGGVRGAIYVWDFRGRSSQPAMTLPPIPNSQGPEEFSLALRGGGAAAQLARLATGGREDIFDLRDPDSAVGVASVNDTSHEDSLISTRFTGSTDHTLPCIQVSASYVVITTSVSSHLLFLVFSRCPPTHLHLGGPSRG